MLVVENTRLEWDSIAKDAVTHTLNAVVLLTPFGQTPNGLRYLRWGGDGEAVQPEKG